MNNFGGVSIPNFIGSLKTLRHLNLSGASFGGSLPSFLGNLTSLRYLDLNTCFSNSNKNDLHWLSTLSNLKHQNLESVDLSMARTYWLEAVNMLPSLEELQLPACGLSILPLSLPLVNLSSLSVLDLSNNGFNSSIPSWLFNISGLEYLDLNSNKIRGEIPDGFADMHFLRNLDLSENSFIEGKLLRRNLRNLCNLLVLDLSFNKISGDIGLFTSSLSRCNNCSLESLHLGYNELGGFLPDSLGHLRNLKNLLLMQNYFLGSIPESIWNLSSLEFFDLSANGMKGTIPRSLGQLSSLVSLDINDNQWEDVITEAHFSNLTSLKELSIVQISGNITLMFNVTSNRIPPFKLIYINLRSCLVGPEFPTWLRHQNELRFIAVWNAGILGSVPDWFWKLDLVLDVLDFSSNQLTGTIPNSIKLTPKDSLGSLTAVKFLSLSRNNLSGEISPTLQNCTSIQSLDLGDNRLSGDIPTWIGETMPSLLVLNLRSNLFTGDIPRELCNLALLHILDLGENNLSGSVPRCIGNMSGFSSIINDTRYESDIDLSSNNLSGDLPEELTNLSRLGTLNLSMNHLTGMIPAGIGRLQLLETLDLSRNQLSGMIPQSMVSMTSLNHLNLSYNNLSGKIPSANQFQTFTDPSIYEGNNGLCGLPLTTCNDDDDESSNSPGSGNKDNENGDDHQMLWFYISMGPGFVVGFWGVYGTLIVKKSWRRVYFEFLDDMKERVTVFVLLNLARLRRSMNKKGTQA
ncbi:hypothetical protein CRYUN_Cryun15aG0009100 [Craigia yunnanensis]